MIDSVQMIIPNDFEAEQAVLGSIIYDNNSLVKVLNILTPTSFYSPAHQYIFRAMLENYNTNIAIDEVLLGDQLKTLNQLDEVGGYVYLSGLIDCAPSSGNIVQYANIIHEASLLREIIALTTDIAKKSRDPENTSTDLIIELNQKIEKINILNNDDTQELRNIFQSSFETLEKLSEKNGGMSGIPSGFIDLDKITTGFQRGNFDIIGARPSMGKTALALNFAGYDFEIDGYDLIISLETSKKKLGLRLLSQQAQVETQKMRTGDLEQEDWDRLAMACDVLTDKKILINDSIDTLQGIVNLIKQKHKQFGLKRVIIDYLQLITGDKKKPREQEIAEISRTFKLLAKELNVNITALCQLNRMLEQRSNKRPMMSDLRESGAIEQDADIIIFIYRDEVYNEDTTDQGMAELLIRKNKDGPIGDVKLAFIGKYTKFCNFSNYDAQSHNNQQEF